MVLITPANGNTAASAKNEIVFHEQFTPQMDVAQ